MSTSSEVKVSLMGTIDHVNLQITNIKLNENNYLLWAQ